MIFDSQKIIFIKIAIFVWTINQIILHLSLLFLPISISVLISNIFSFPLRYYFYGKNVFYLNKPNIITANRFIIFSFLLWSINTIGTNYIYQFGFNKNISAIIMIPFVASISFLMQKYYVFKK
tara:strand:- start:119 stop:487 length:369 start_codon:yes stop_codon:yes gene_type:complete